MLQGTVYAKAEVDIGSSHLTLTDAVIASYSSSGNKDGEGEMESWTLNFKTMTVGQEDPKGE
jgi:type VI protein secretion system component Hcp